MSRTTYIVIACVLSLAIRYIGAQYPHLVEWYYADTLFVAIRYLLTGLFSWLPFPAVCIVLPLMLYVLVRSAYRAYIQHSNATLPNILYQIFARIVGTAALFLTIFLWIWGYNYQRIKLAEKLDLNIPTSIPLEVESYSTLCLLDSIRQQLHIPDSTPISDVHLRFDKERETRQALQTILQILRYPSAQATLRARKLPPGTLLRVGIAGIYFPYSGEGHYDGGLHPLSQLFTIPHELAHGYGFGDEGECNFLAYLACTNAPSNLYIQYAGHLYYARYLWSTYRHQYPKQYLLFAQQIPQGIANDLKDIRKYAARYPDIAPRLQDATNHAYLKTQGIRTGIKSYDEIVPLVWAWKYRQSTKTLK